MEQSCFYLAYFVCFLFALFCQSFRAFTPAFRAEFIPLLHNCLLDILCNMDKDDLKCVHSDIFNDIINSMKIMALSVKSINQFYHTGGDKLKQEITSKKIQSQNNPDFGFWDGLYQDLENLVLKFLTVHDLQILSRVAKKFEFLVNNSKIIQKNSIKCWFYHSPNHFDGHRLCLGLGVKPKFFTTIDNGYDSIGNVTNFQIHLRRQFERLCKIFPQEYESYFTKLISSIGDRRLLNSLDTSFDLLSSEAFEKHGIRNSVFNDYSFTHFIPLWIENKHGELCMKKLPEYIRRIFDPYNVEQVNYHPFLALYCVAVTMLSTIKSVVYDNVISSYYSTSVIETFFRYYHLLLAIYCENEEELSPLIQHQMELFFRLNNHKIKNKKCIPNLGVFVMFLPLWEQKKQESEDGKNKIEWKDIVLTLLNETLTRQVRNLLSKEPKLAKIGDRKERLDGTWEASDLSRKMFLFELFFIKHCAPTVYGSNYVSLHDQLDKYNRNYGFAENSNMLSLKLQQFVSKVHSIQNYEEFFEMIELRVLLFFCFLTPLCISIVGVFDLFHFLLLFF